MEGVDNIPELEVIDKGHNRYSDLFGDIVQASSCCILNIRNSTKIDFASFSTRGQSVVD